MKLLSLIVVLLFVSISFFPSVNGNINVDYVENQIDDNDCGCEKLNDWDFPVICSFLLFLYRIVLCNLPFLLFAHIIEITAANLGGCPGIP